jgi:hypothetical protein
LSVLRDRFRVWLEKGERRWVLPAIAGAGLAQISAEIVAAFTEQREAAMKMPANGYLALLVIWPICALGFTWLNAVMLRWTGRWLKGVATIREIYAAQGWSLTPIALASPLMAAKALALSRGAADPDQVEGLPEIASLIVGAVFLYASVLFILRFVVSLSEVQKFSKLRVLGNVALTLLLALTIILIVLGGLSRVMPD